eukprot:GFUD01021542.1.p1 GENE.GFUD01021542.1~~GFUD01021542.1.p1  ORF type:complete len:222 (-),score=55.50 GFUD01021542.1:176-841(-)
MGRKLLPFSLSKESPSEKWGFAITGGKDVGLTARIEKVNPFGPAGFAGLSNLDYLVKIGEQEIFDMRHNDIVNLIKNSGDVLQIEIERAITEDDVVVPSFDMLYPKQKVESHMVDYIQDAMRTGIKGSCGMFTSLGKPRVKVKGGNSSIGLFSEDTIMELATGSSHGFVEESKLDPNCAPSARNRKHFDPSKSSTLMEILAQENKDARKKDDQVDSGARTV